MMEKQLIPQLRFSEFEGEWKSIKIGKIGKPSMCKRIMKDQTLSDGDIPFYKIGTFGKEADAYINNDLYIEYKTKFSFPKKGDILISASGTIGRTVIYDGKPAFFQDSNIVWIDNNEEKVLNALLVYSYENVRWTTENTTIARLYNDNLKNISIAVPQIPEQQKIASFLTNVDDKITKLTKKKELLEQYKKGIMQKIFNQELRFKDDNGNEFPLWQKNKLGKSVKFLKGKGLPKSEIVCDGQYKCIHYGELFTKYNELIDNIISRTNDNDKTILSKVNDVLMPTSDVTPNGLATASCIKESDVILGGDVLIIRQDIKKIEGVYLAYYIKHFRNDVMKLVSGSTVYHLYGSDMKNLQVLIPCLDEQIKIANFLTDIDLKITVLNTKIESNQTFKKGLLQKMFV